MKEDDSLPYGADAPTKSVAGPVLGLDVSSVQASVNWAAVYAAGYRFVYVKATDGIRDIDPCLAKHMNGARAAGLVAGAYHFLSPALDPIAQARHFHDAVSAVGDPMLPPVLDFEYPLPEAWRDHNVDGPSLCSKAATFVQVASPLFNRKLVVYTFPYFWRALPVDDANLHLLVQQCDLWIASYGGIVPDVPRPWGGWKWWQVSGNGGYVTGVAGECDNDRFNGSAEDLAALAT